MTTTLNVAVGTLVRDLRTGAIERVTDVGSGDTGKLRYWLTEDGAPQEPRGPGWSLLMLLTDWEVIA